MADRARKRRQHGAGCRQQGGNDSDRDAWDVWQSIARGEIRGDAALAKGMYRVTGDFSLMIHWDDFFGAANAAAGKENPEKIPTGGQQKKKNSRR